MQGWAGGSGLGRRFFSARSGRHPACIYPSLLNPQPSPSPPNPHDSPLDFPAVKDELGDLMGGGGDLFRAFDLGPVRLAGGWGLLCVHIELFVEEEGLSLARLLLRLSSCALHGSPAQDAAGGAQGGGTGMGGAPGAPGSAGGWRCTARAGHMPVHHTLLRSPPPAAHSAPFPSHPTSVFSLPPSPTPSIKQALCPTSTSTPLSCSTSYETCPTRRPWEAAREGRGAAPAAAAAPACSRAAPWAT